MDKKKYRVLDLFAGAGGLSLGFRLSNLFEITTAIENNMQMQKTYTRNHSKVRMLSDVLNYIDFNAFDKEYGPFDVVVGGPPCQGFSLANRQHNQMINVNNLLVKQYVNFILGLKPKAFVMENVKNLCSQTQCYILTKAEFSDALFSKYLDQAKDVEIIIPKGLSDEYYKNGSFKIVQFDFLSLKKRVHLFDRRGKEENVEAFKKNLLENLPVDDECINKRLKRLVELYHIPKKGTSSDLFAEINNLSMISELMKYDSYVSKIEYVDTRAVIHCKALRVTDYIHAMLSPYYEYKAKIYNTALYGVPQLRQRFVIIGKRKDIDSPIFLPRETNTIDNALTVRDAIEDLEVITPTDSVNAKETVVEIESPSYKHPWNDSKIIHNNVIPKTGPLALERFKAIKQGENFHDLPKNLKESYADPSRTQQSIYKRLNYDEPSNTVTNARKCMWIHPKFDRGISVREAARLQSFPDSFIFEGDKDKQYQQIGNAVPPVFAKAIAESVASILDYN